MDALGLGLTLGLAASLSPGPLLVLVVTSALRWGPRSGVLTAAAPLLSDAVVVAVTLLLLDRLPARALGVLGVVGAVFVVWTGVRDARTATLDRATTATTATTDTPDTPATTDTDTPAPDNAVASQASPPRGTLDVILPARSDNSGSPLRRAVLVNLLSPHPWIAWATALGPLTITTWHASAGAGVALVLGFYLALVGGKVVIALLVARGRRRLGDTGYRRALACAGGLLVLAGVVMGVEFAGYGM
ncbi:MAG: LysE family transporter [Saccharothrix sp.]|nr:LysE family transporter [Saccharothrix sp.]